jgi:sortase A
MTSKNGYNQTWGSRNSILHWASWLCLLAGSILLVWFAYLWADAHIYEAMERQRFDAVVEGPAAISHANPEKSVTEATRSKIEVGSVLGRIEIPRIGVSVMVLEGDTSRIFRRAAGHLRGTAAPGEWGNVAIAAHRDTFFRPLRNIRDQDLITFTTLAGSYSYQVESTDIVEPDDLQVLADSPQPTLTLVTCYPFYYVGPAPKRFIVRARQILSDSRVAPQNLGVEDEAGN